MWPSCVRNLGGELNDKEYKTGLQTENSCSRQGVLMAFGALRLCGWEGEAPAEPDPPPARQEPRPPKVPFPMWDSGGHSATLGQLAESNRVRTCQLSRFGTSWHRIVEERWRSGGVAE